jgi:hypothetical protein
MLLPDSWNSLMPKGKDFLAEFVAMTVVDADADVESLEALPAVISVSDSAGKPRQ